MRITDEKEQGVKSEGDKVDKKQQNDQNMGYTSKKQPTDQAKADSSQDNAIFLDILNIMDENDKVAPPTPVFPSDSGENAMKKFPEKQIDSSKKMRKTLLARLESYQTIKEAYEKLKNGEDADLPIDLQTP
jgi:hypothetical protein